MDDPTYAQRPGFMFAAMMHFGLDLLARQTGSDYLQKLAGFFGEYVAIFLFVLMWYAFDPTYLWINILGLVALLYIVDLSLDPYLTGVM